MPNTSGLVNRRHVIASSDAAVVSRLKQAGAIPLGVTNCSELCMWYESSNRLYGRTNNPYDLQRIAGGSSGEPQPLRAMPWHIAWLPQRSRCSGQMLHPASLLLALALRADSSAAVALGQGHPVAVPRHG